MDIDTDLVQMADVHAPRAHPLFNSRLQADVLIAVNYKFQNSMRPSWEVYRELKRVYGESQASVA